MFHRPNSRPFRYDAFRLVGALGFLAMFTLWAGLARASSEVTLVMVEQTGCHYCALWNAEIAPAYPKTDEGQFAPLRRVDLHDLPQDLSFERRVMFTPTFVVVGSDGAEVGRIEGYPGAHFFWGVLAQVLKDKAGYAPSVQGTEVSQ